MQRSEGDPDSESAKAFMTALEGQEFQEASDYLNEDFLFSGWTPQPLNKQNFLDTFKNLKEGIPGLIFNLHNVSDNANHQVNGTIKIAGYQSDSFILPALGTPPIPQMARSVSLPSEEVTFVLNNGKISQMQVHLVEGGGIQGLLEQLGIDLPIIQ
jgi:hypothetical protein